MHEADGSHRYTLLRFNSSPPENRPSQKETSLPTTIFQGYSMLNFGGGSFFGNERNKLPFDLHQPSQNHQDHPKPNNFGFKTKDVKM